MTSGYSFNGTDYDDYLEPYISSPAVNANGETLSKYNVNGVSMENRYQKANTDDWGLTLDTLLKVNGSSVVGVRKGYLPTQTLFAELTSAGTYNISVSSSGLTIGSTTYPESHFRNGVLPQYIGIMICGAGGGAGGWGCEKGDKNGYNITPAGAGAGGGIALCVVKTSSLSSVTIGAGGSAGSNGSGDSRPSSGSNGNTGGSSYITTSVGTITTYGGDGGEASGGDYYGIGGRGGPCGGSLTDGKLITTMNGGAGGSAPFSESGIGKTVSNFSFTTDANIPTSTMFSNSDTSYSYSSGDSYRDSWAGGGCSIGSGATNSSIATKGGGGASGKNNKNGASGYCAFYY